MAFRLFRGLSGWFTGLFLIVALLAALVAWLGWRAWTGPGPNSGPGTVSTVLVNIPAGMTLASAADTLAARGLLGDRRVMLAGSRLTGQDRGLRAGLYQLEYGTSARQLLANLTTGLSVQVKVTIPEGLDALATANIVAQFLDFPAERFLAAADSLARLAAVSGDLLDGEEQITNHDSILRSCSVPDTRAGHWSEGYLAPDTYLFSVGTGPVVAASHLIATQMARLDTLLAGGGGANPAVSSGHHLLTLASIVEAEARHDNERGQVAAVYTNRLQKRWRLEADPTVAFILGKKGKRLFYKDLAVESPYNTYRNRGLPPGPINSPGWKALQAAANPDSTCSAMYFVSDGKGGHIFSRTAREHEEAVRNFRKLKAAERRQGGH